MNYYFTVASLPMLFYDRDMPMSRGGFLEACGKELTRGDLEIIEGTSIRNLERTSPACFLLDRWRTWETALRNQLVRLRASGKGWEADKYLRESEDVYGVAEIAREAFGQGSPLDGEEILNRARWSYLDELETGHHFDVEKLVAYCLKLQILERKSSFDKNAGTQKLEQVLTGKTDPGTELSN